MADSPMTLSEHLSTQQAALSTEHARNVAAVLGRIGRVAAVIAQELAHAALRDQLGYVGGANATGDQVKKLDVWGHETMVSRAPRDAGLRRARLRGSRRPHRDGRGRHARPRGLRGSGGRLVEPRRQRRGGHDLLAARPSRGKTPAGPAALGPVPIRSRRGYVMYGPATTLVYTVGRGHARLHARPARPASSCSRIPTSASRSAGKTYGINEGNVTTWHPGQRAFVEHLKTPDKASGPALLAPLLGGDGRRRAPHAAGRRALHVPRRLDRSGQAQAQAAAALRGRADGACSSSRRAGARAPASSACWTSWPPSITSERPSSSAAPRTWRLAD